MATVISVVLKCDELGALERTEKYGLHKSLATFSEIDEVLVTEDVQDLLGEDQKKEAEDHTENIRKKKAEQSQFWHEISNRKARARLGHGPSEPPLSRPRSEDDGLSSPRGRMELPAEPAAYTMEFVQALFPPYARVWKDGVAGRWQVFLKSGGRASFPWQSRSRAWRRYGHQGCVTQLLEWAWTDRTTASTESVVRSQFYFFPLLA